MSNPIAKKHYRKRPVHIRAVPLYARDPPFDPTTAGHHNGFTSSSSSSSLVRGREADDKSEHYDGEAVAMTPRKTGKSLSLPRKPSKIHRESVERYVEGNPESATVSASSSYTFPFADPSVPQEIFIRKMLSDVPEVTRAATPTPTKDARFVQEIAAITAGLSLPDSTSFGAETYSSSSVEEEQQTYVSLDKLERVSVLLADDHFLPRNDYKTVKNLAAAWRDLRRILTVPLCRIKI